LQLAENILLKFFHECSDNQKKKEAA